MKKRRQGLKRETLDALISTTLYFATIRRKLSLLDAIWLEKELLSVFTQCQYVSNN